MAEESAFTSIYARVQALKSHNKEGVSQASQDPARHLMPFRDSASDSEPSLPLSLADYLQLVDWPGRAVRSDKRGALDERIPPILQRLNIDRDVWQQAMQIRGNVFGRALGKLDYLCLHARSLRQSRSQGAGYAQRLFG